MRKAMGVVVVALSLLFVAIGTSAQDNDAWIPGLASFVLPGLGQVLNDQVDRAIVHFGVDVAIWAVGFYVGMFFPYGYYAIPALHLGWAVFSGFDAYNVAKDTGFSIGFVRNGITLSYSY
ncbi:MAG: hypothetical protein WBC63_07505 [Candidatus Bipolaricaulia bacterium]